MTPLELAARAEGRAEAYRRAAGLAAWAGGNVGNQLIRLAEGSEKAAKALRAAIATRESKLEAAS